MASKGGLLALVAIVFLLGLIVGVLAGGEEPVDQGRELSDSKAGNGAKARVLEGKIIIDGSSTVYPLTEAIAEWFMEEYEGVDVVVGISGTGGGFKRFVIGEIDINDASRRIKDVEVEMARERGVEWIESPVAIDGIVVAVNKENDWVDCISLEDLRAIWGPDSRVRKWSDARPGWPDEEIVLYGPGPDSGTFDYFTEAVIGESGSSRTDYVASEDDNVLVEGIAGEKYALGYFGYAYYYENRDRVKALAIMVNGTCIEPSIENIRSFKYPLARPLFIYVNKEYFESREELREFVFFYLENAAKAAEVVGYVPFSEHYYRAAKGVLREGVYEGLYQLVSVYG